MLAASATAKAASFIIINSSGLRSSPCSISSSGLHSPPRNISSRRSISSSHRSSNIASASSSSHQDTWREGIIAYLFPLRPVGHFYAECRAIPPAPLNTCPPAPYTAPQGYPQIGYSAISPVDYASSSEGEYGLQVPTPPAPHGPPVPSDSSWSFSTDRAVMTHFVPQASLYLWMGLCPVVRLGQFRLG